MTLPRFLYGDPSKHVDYIRRKREQYEASQKQNKADRAKEGLEKLFKSNDEKEKENG